MRFFSRNTFLSRRSAITIIVFLIIFCFSFYAFYPNFSGFYFIDDYVFLAITRYIENPLTFYYTSHFPGGLFYRPTGMLLWWFVSSFESGVWFQYLVNWLLIATTSLLLYRVLLIMEVKRWVSLFLVALFLVHPITQMTAGWLSSRFDLLASLGVLITIYYSVKWHKNNRDKVSLFFICIGFILAISSKELGLILPFLVFLIALFHSKRLIDFIPSFILSVFSIAYYFLRKTLTSGVEKNLLENGFFYTVNKGVVNWLSHSVDFLFPYSIIYLFAVILIFFICFGYIFLYVNSNKLLEKNTLLLMVTGTALLGLSMLIQFPVTAYNVINEPNYERFDEVSFFASRFYYLSFIGVIIFLGGLLKFFLRLVNNKLIKYAFIALFILCFSRFIMVSHTQNLLWSAHSSGLNKTMAESAAASVESDFLNRQDINSMQACRYYFINSAEINPDFSHFSDSIVKALVTKELVRGVGRCLISTEYTPWYYIVYNPDGRVLSAIDQGPHEFTCNNLGEIRPTQKLDNVNFYLLSYPFGGYFLNINTENSVFRYNRESGIFEKLMSGEVYLNSSHSENNKCY